MGGLLERETELAAIGAALDGAKGGAGGLVLVRGVPGIGKTRLLRAAKDEATERGLAVLTARGGELEREQPFGIARQLLERPVAERKDRERRRLLQGAPRLAADLLLEADREPDRPGGGGDIFPVLHGLYWLCVNLSAERPLCLVVDNLRWADEPSLRFLDYLVRRAEDVPVLAVAGMRTTENERVRPMVERILEQPRTRPIEPAPLSEEASAHLLAEHFDSEPDPEFVSACHARTGGVPFLLEELARTLAADDVAPRAQAADQVERVTPDAVSRSVLARIARLPTPAHALARAASVFDSGVALRHAAALAELREAEATDTADRLAAAAIVEPGSPLEFVHPLARTAIYEDIDPARRAEMHKRAAGLLRDAGHPADEVAAHLLHTEPGGKAWVVETLRAAGSAASARGAVESAIAHLRRALAEPPPDERRAEVLCELGEAESLTEGEAAHGHLRDAFDLTGDPLQRARIAERLAWMLFFTGHPRGAMEVAERAIEELGPREPDFRRQLEGQIILTTTHEPDLWQRGEQLAVRLREHDLLAEGGYGSRALTGVLAFHDARRLRASREQVVARARHALGGGLLLEGDPGVAPPFFPAILALAYADEPELALESAANAREKAVRGGDVSSLGACATFSCPAHLLRGDLAGAIADGEQGRREFVEYGNTIAPAWAAGYLADAYMLVGDLGSAERTLARGAPTDMPDNAHWHWYLDARCRYLILRGELRAAVAATLDCGRRFERVGGENPALMPWRSRAALCLAGLSEEPERARELAAEEVELARAWGAPRALGAALRAQGRVLGGDEGLERLREAVEVLDGSPARFEHARALVDLGAALRRSNRRADAREPLKRGMDLAHACGARPLAERAREELKATGARPRKLVLSGVESLTPSERRVADMAAEGMSNPEIAQALFVTRKTVETHLGHVYQKLDIPSREELPSALGEAQAAKT